MVISISSVEALGALGMSTAFPPTLIVLTPLGSLPMKSPNVTFVPFVRLLPFPISIKSPKRKRIKV